MDLLQIGLEWFPQRGGGLDRMFYGLSQNFHLADVNTQSLVTASENIADHTVHRFASPDSALLLRWYAERTEVTKLKRDNDFDLVASHFALNTFPVLDKIDDIPLVFHFHGPWALESSAERKHAGIIWAKKQIELASYRAADAFIVLSKAFQSILHQEYSIPLEQIHIVPGGVDMKQFSVTQSPFESRAALGWPQDRKILLSVRRLAKRMGLENLIRSVSDIRLQHPDILLCIAGKGYLQSDLEVLIDELDLKNHVKLLGFVPDSQLPTAYRAANMSVVPSVSLEGFGLIVIESLACGTPVLASPVGGIPEILAPLSSDLLMEGSSPSQIAHGILEGLSGERYLPSEKDCCNYVEKTILGRLSPSR